MESLTFTLLGRPASKKNSRQNFFQRGRMISIPSKQHKAFEKDALLQLLSVRKPQWSCPVEVHYKFYQKGRMTQDYDNAIGTINDLMQAAGIIVDDNQITKGSFAVIRGVPEWRTEVYIAPIRESVL